MNEKNILWIFMHIPKTGGSTLNQHIKANLKKNQQTQLGQNPKVQPKNSPICYVHGHASTYYGVHKFFPGKEPRYLVFLRDPAKRLVSEYNYQIRNKMVDKSISFHEWYKNQIKNEMTHILSRNLEGKRGTRFQTPVFLIPIVKRINAKTKFMFYLRHFIVRKATSIDNSIKGNDKKFENAKKMLDLCYHVGITETLDNDLKLIFKEIGVSQKWENQLVAGKSESEKDLTNNFKLDKKTEDLIKKENPLDYELYKYAISLNKGLLLKGNNH